MLTKQPTKRNPKNQISFDSLPIWQQQIISSIKSLRYASGLNGDPWNKFNKKAIQSLRPYIPYLVHETETPGTYILVNRDYRPLGTNWSNMVDYSAYKHMHISHAEVAQIRPHYFHFQGWANSVDGNFFMDDTAPWISKENAKAVLARLESLISALAIKGVAL